MGVPKLEDLEINHIVKTKTTTNKNLIQYKKGPCNFTFSKALKVNNVFEEVDSNGNTNTYLELALSKKRIDILKKIAYNISCNIEAPIKFKLTSGNNENSVFYYTKTKEPQDLPDNNPQELLDLKILPLVRILGVDSNGNIVLKIVQMIVAFEEKDVDFECISEEE